MQTNAGYLVNYVGITNNTISNRLQDHLSCYCRGLYTIYEPELFKEGKKKIIHQPTDSILEFLPKIKLLIPKLELQLKAFSIFIAEVDSDKGWLERIESGIISELRQYSQITRDFIDNARLSKFIEDKDKIEILLSYPEPMVGLNEKIRI